MVIVITGIIAGIVAIFIRRPVEAYIDSARRAALTDIADTAARRLARDLQAALPNSVRVDGSGQLLEFIPIHDGGRYRAEIGTAAGDDPLDFTSADNRFDVLGPPVTVGDGDSLVIYNLGIAGADAYETAPLSARRAAQVVWTLTSPEVHLLMRDTGGWSRAAYRAWLEQTIADSILGGRDGG